MKLFTFLIVLLIISFFVNTQAKENTIQIPAIAKRPVIYKRTITTRNRSLKVEIYDADEDDGDIASVKFNGYQILKQIKLTKKTKKTFIIYPKKGRNTLILQADNLGLMSPNTAALNLYDGKKLQTRLILKSDLKNSEGIIINYKPRVKKAK